MLQKRFLSHTLTCKSTRVHTHTHTRPRPQRGMHIPGEGLSKLKLRCSGLVAAAQSTWAGETRLWFGWGQPGRGAKRRAPLLDGKENGIPFQLRARSRSLDLKDLCSNLSPVEENPTSPRLGRKKCCSSFAQDVPLAQSLEYLSGMCLKGREQPTQVQGQKPSCLGGA